jgi:hypothetical protein
MRTFWLFIVVCLAVAAGGNCLFAASHTDAGAIAFFEQEVRLLLIKRPF